MEQLSTRTPGWDKRLDMVLSRSRAVAPEIERGVADIIARVKTQGDQAVMDLTREFDRFDPEKQGLCIEASEISSASGRSTIKGGNNWATRGSLLA